MLEKYLPKSKKGVRLKTISYTITGFACAVILLTVYGIYQIDIRSQDMSAATDKYVAAGSAINLLDFYSDYLTDRTRLYILTKDYSYVEEYFDEVHNGMHKKHSLNLLKRQMFPGNAEVCGMLDEFMTLSDQMMDVEIHAMKLMAVLDEISPDVMPEMLASYELSDEELTYSEAELVDAAYRLVFGNEYIHMRLDADEKMSAVQEKITSITKAEREEAGNKMRHAIINQKVYIVMLFVALMGLLLMFILLVLKPIYAIEESIKNQERLKEVGPRELRDLIKTYNHMAEINAESKVELAREAEHDAMTGLLNRGAFDKLKGYLKESVEPTALILLDVDNFKGVNDTYGHQVGDEALKKVAELLKEHFRANDYPARTGGDEFAVIMLNITPKEKDVIRGKINAMNEVLQKPEGNIPKLSLSAGIAFSQIGYKEELYNKADEALYKTKEKGKCGYTFYGDWK